MSDVYLQLTRHLKLKSMNKRLFIVTLSCFLLGSLQLVMGQNTGPVSWTVTAQRLSSDSCQIVMTAQMQGNWHLYSQSLSSDEGPLPTVFTFDSAAHVKTIGAVIEPADIHEEFDPNFQVTVRYFNVKAEFRQLVLGKSGASVKGGINYMCCNDETCLPPTDFNFEIELP